MDDNKIEPNVVDAQIVEEVPISDTLTSDTTDNSTVVSSLDEMIRLSFRRLNELQNEAKKLKDMVEDALAGSEAYKIVSEKAKETINEKTQIRKNLLSIPEMISLLNKNKEISSEIKEKRISISDYILEFQRLSGANEIDLGDGEVMQIENSAKLVKKR